MIFNKIQILLIKKVHSPLQLVHGTFVTDRTIGELVQGLDKRSDQPYVLRRENAVLQ